jgi:DNA-binding NarL/FixJ family response regulator
MDSRLAGYDEGGAGDPAAPLRVLVVARSPLGRAGLRGLLGEQAEVRVIGSVSATDEVAPAVAAARPDLVLAAWEAGDRDLAVALAESLTAAGLPLVLLGEPPGLTELSQLIGAGLRGYLLPDASAEEVTAALRAAAQGLLVLDPALARTLPALVSSLATDEAELVAELPLTDREREVLGLLALGLPNKTIAKRLGVSEHTIKFHVGSILAKLGAGSRTEAVTRAARRGWLAL